MHNQSQKWGRVASLRQPWAWLWLTLIRTVTETLQSGYVASFGGFGMCRVGASGQGLLHSSALKHGGSVDVPWSTCVRPGRSEVAHPALLQPGGEKEEKILRKSPHQPHNRVPLSVPLLEQKSPGLFLDREAEKLCLAQILTIKQPN